MSKSKPASKAAADNKSNQGNPTSLVYYTSRGLPVPANLPSGPLPENVPSGSSPQDK